MLSINYYVLCPQITLTSVWIYKARLQQALNVMENKGREQITSLVLQNFKKWSSFESIVFRGKL